MVPKDLVDLRRLYGGFQASRVILTANNLGVFDKITKPLSAKALARRLKTDERATEILLDALTGVGLVRKSKAGTYRNAPTATRYLVKGARHYQGDILRHASTMWDNWSGLDDVLRTGKPANGAFEHRSFIMGMHNLSLLRADGLLEAIGLEDIRTMLDLGGGPGTNAMAMARKGVRATIFDLPPTITIARRLARRDGIQNLSFIAGDFHVDDIGSGYDLILLSQIFHAFSEEENLALLEKCRKAANPGGRVVIQEFPIDTTRTRPPHGALFSVNMLVATPGGRCYTVPEMKGWLRESGFLKIRETRLPETVLVEGRGRR